MPEQRISVWVQAFKDRPNLMLQWHEPDTGRRRTKSAGTNDPEEAETTRADLEYELNHGRYQEASRMSWEQFRERFEEEYLPNLRQGTQLAHHLTLDCFEKTCKPARIRSINERTISAFAAGMRRIKTCGRVGLKPSTIRSRLRFLKAALRWAVTQKMIPALPAFPVIKVAEKDPQPIPAEAVDRMLAKAPNPQWKAFLLCAWLAGLRFAEALALEWDETDAAPYLDLKRNRIVLPSGFVKAGKDQWVPLDATLREALTTLPRRGRTVFHFVTPEGKPRTESSIRHGVRAIAKQAGVRLMMHSLRKGFGCRYAGKVPAQVLQKLMRHSSVVLTMKYYANVDAAVEEAVLGDGRNTSRNTEAGPETDRNAGEVAEALPRNDFRSSHV